MIYPSHKRPIEYINKIPYVVHAVIPIERCKDVIAIKDWLGCDTTFKVKNQSYWFCEEIQELNWEYV